MAKLSRAAEGTSAANAAVTATLAGFAIGTTGSTGGWLFIRGFIATWSAPITVAGVATLTGLDTVATLHFQIATTTLNPFIFMLPDSESPKVANNTNAVLTFPAAGASVVCTIQLYGYVQ